MEEWQDAKEYAKELIDKFRIHQPVWEVKEDAKECALIAVDEVLDALGHHYWQNKLVIEFYEEVRKEIIKSE